MIQPLLISGNEVRIMPYFRIIVTCIFLFFSIKPYAQTIKGRITATSGEAIPYATVYITELRQGTVSNTKGDYELNLPTGNFTIHYQSLGYEPVFASFNITTDSTIIKNVTLVEQFYEIPEVSISPAGEDLAYSIMRKAIGLAPYHLNQLNYYKANVYIKGNLVINKIPRIIQKSMRAKQSGDAVTISAGGRPESSSVIIKEGDSFFMESLNEIEFTSPDKYIQRVISFNSTFPQEDNNISPMDYIKASFYQPVLAEIAISPLSPQSFSHYRFKYTGTSLQGNYIINKIEVIPRRKSQQLFSGTIYIVEDLWCLHSIDLTNENIAGTIRIRELYIPVQNEVWMPASHNIGFSFKMFGIMADAGYATSVRYLDMALNNDLQKPADLISESTPNSYAPDESSTKNRQKIEKLLQKDEMSNRDMIKLASLMEKETERSIPDSIRKDREIKEKTVFIYEKDAARKDSAYWAEIRPVPLSATEKKSLVRRDSMENPLTPPKEMTDETDTTNERKHGYRFAKSMSNLFKGNTWRDTSGFSFTYGGLIKLPNLSFNTVDGFVYGMNFRISKSYHKGRNISLYPDIRYAFSRKKLMWRANFNYSAGGMKQSNIFMRAGMSSRDISNDGKIEPVINTLTSLLIKKNYMKLYDTRYFTLGYSTEIINGLYIELSANYDNRHLADNSTDFCLIRSSREYSRNIPDNRYLDPEMYPSFSLSNHRHLSLLSNIKFTPYQKYTIVTGQKLSKGSDWPEFIFTWKHGINNFTDDISKPDHFDMFSFEVSQRKDLGALTRLRWSIKTGGFADNRNVTWFDFFHFNSQPFPLMLSDYEDAFMLPGFYSLNTPEFFGEFHLKYTTPYLLIKYLPGLSGTLVRENISFSMLGSRYSSTYTEIGYTLSELFLIGEAGVFAGFNDKQFNSIGVKITLRIN